MKLTPAKPLWKKLLPVITLAFFGLVAWSLYGNLSKLDFQEVRAALGKIPLAVICLAGALAWLNYGVLTSFDYIGSQILKLRQLTYPRVFVSAFICYAFTMNIGALVGGMGFRYRIYSGWKVSKGDIGKLILYSSCANWLGYTTLLGCLLVFKGSSLKDLPILPNLPLAPFGGLFLGITVAYFVMCARGKILRAKGHAFAFPAIKYACLQLVLSCSQWTLVALIMHQFFQALGAQINFSETLFTLLLAGIAGVVTHIPAGLGVVEAIFLKTGLDAPDSVLIAGLLGYRAIYYLMPLAFALPGYFLLELHQKRRRKIRSLRALLPSFLRKI